MWVSIDSGAEVCTYSCVSRTVRPRDSMSKGGSKATITIRGRRRYAASRRITRPDSLGLSNRNSTLSLQRMSCIVMVEH